MKFRKLSIAGTSWLHDADLAETGDEAAVELEKQDLPRTPRRSLAAQRELAEAGPSAAEAGRPSIALSHITPMSPTAPPSMIRRSSSHWRSTGRPDHVQPDLTTVDLLEYIQLRPHSDFSRRATQYILAMALCHTCLPELRDGRVEFQAASPDELALVQAAQDLGFLVIQRSSRSVTLRISRGEEESESVHEILDIIEFSSKRKRMSIVVRCPDGRIWLLTKGADSVILPRLKMAPLAMQKATEVRKSLDSGARAPAQKRGPRASEQLRRQTQSHHQEEHASAG